MKQKYSSYSSVCTEFPFKESEMSDRSAPLEAIAMARRGISMRGNATGRVLALTLGVILCFGACSGSSARLLQRDARVRGMDPLARVVRSHPLRMHLRGGGAEKGGTATPAFKPPQVGATCNVQSTLRIMEIAKYPKDPEVAKKALEQLWWICVNAEKQKRIGAFKGGCKALITALQNHWKDASVMIEAMSFACNLAFAQPNIPFGMHGWSHIINQDEIGRMGGVRLIVNAMKEHLTTPEIQNAGTRALANLAYNHSANAERVVKWGGIEVALAAMQVHRENLAIQEAGCVFLWSCLTTIVNETHITYGPDYMGAPAGGQQHIDLRIAGRVAELGGVQAVVNALSRFGNDTSLEAEGINVGEQGCAALYYLAYVPGRLRETVRAHGAVDLAKMVIRTQGDVSPCARTWGARLLEMLTSKNCSKYMMHVQVPGPNAFEDRKKEIEKGVRVCQPGCGCDERFGPVGQEKDEMYKSDDGEKGFVDPDWSDDGKQEDWGDDSKGTKKKKKKGKRIQFEKVPAQDGGAEEGEVGSEDGDDGDMSDDDRAGTIAMRRTQTKLAKKKYELNVGRYKANDAKARKDLRAAEERRHKEKSMTAQDFAKEREMQGFDGTLDRQFDE